MMNYIAVCDVMNLANHLFYAVNWNLPNIGVILRVQNGQDLTRVTRYNLCTIGLANDCGIQDLKSYKLARKLYIKDKSHL